MEGKNEREDLGLLMATGGLMMGGAGGVASNKDKIYRSAPRVVRTLIIKLYFIIILFLFRKLILVVHHVVSYSSWPVLAQVGVAKLRQ